METKKLPTLSTDLQAECTHIPAKQADVKTAKSFLDYMWTCELPGAIKIGEVELCIFVDESGSMSTDCGGQTRKQAAHAAIQAILGTLPTGILVSMTAFATDHCTLIPRTVLMDTNRQRLILNVIQAHRTDIGIGTAIHENVLSKMHRLRDDAKESKGIKASLIVVLTDGQDNSGEMPWTDDAAKTGSMRPGLKQIADLTKEILSKRRCAVQLAFVAVSKDACWNVIRELNQAEGLNTMGGVVNQDGLYLTELLEFFTSRFLNTAYLQTTLQIETVPPLPCRILDCEPSSKETKAGESYGANYIQTPWTCGKTQRHIGTLVSGQNLGLVIQVSWPLQEDASIGLDKIQVKATLSGHQQPLQAGDEYLTGTITSTDVCVPVITTETQFDQSLHKFRLRLSKQKANLLAHVSVVYDFLNNEKNFGGYGARQLSRLLPECKPQFGKLVDAFNLLITDIQKDCRQEVEDRLRRKYSLEKAEALITKRGQRILQDPFYILKPVIIGGQSGFTEGYNTLMEDARVLQFYLTHSYFQDEAAAKALALINPQRALELVKPTFKGLALTGSQSMKLYENLFGKAITDGETKVPWQQEWQKLYQDDMSKYKANIPPRMYPRSVLLGLAQSFLKTGLSPEALARIQDEALSNADKTVKRYPKRVPLKD